MQSNLPFILIDRGVVPCRLLSNKKHLSSATMIHLLECLSIIVWLLLQNYWRKNSLIGHDEIFTFMNKSDEKIRGRFRTIIFIYLFDVFHLCVRNKRSCLVKVTQLLQLQFTPFVILYIGKVLFLLAIINVNYYFFTFPRILNLLLFALVSSYNEDWGIVSQNLSYI